VFEKTRSTIKSYQTLCPGVYCHYSIAFFVCYRPISFTFYFGNFINFFSLSIDTSIGRRWCFGRSRLMIWPLWIWSRVIVDVLATKADSNFKPVTVTSLICMSLMDAAGATLSRHRIGRNDRSWNCNYAECHRGKALGKIEWRLCGLYRMVTELWFFLREGNRWWVACLVFGKCCRLRSFIAVDCLLYTVTMVIVTKKINEKYNDFGRNRRIAKMKACTAEDWQY